MPTWVILEDDRFNFDYSHFLLWHTSQCASLHGHSSVITVMLRGEPDATGLVVDFGEAKRVVKEALGRFDHKLIAPASTVMAPPDAHGTLEIAFATAAGPHRLFLPATEVAVIASDATVEYLSALLAEAILQALPANVQRVMVRMFEGGQIGHGHGGRCGRWRALSQRGHRCRRPSPLDGRTPHPRGVVIVSTWQVSEIFYSIQGEGATTGRATAFIRLGGCTLGCQWCDTKYTWRGGPMRAKTQILATVTAYPTRRVVVTGGEPFEQDIAALLQGLRQAGFTIEIETAGFAPLAQVQCAPLAHQLNVSPKLANSGVPAERRIQLPVLQFLRDTGKAYFKFVIDAPGDLAEVDTLVATLSLSADRVLLMPQALTAEEVLHKSRWLVEACKVRGYGYSPRLHILLWGAKRGV